LDRHPEEEESTMAICASCHSEIAPGIRWCTICRSNTVDPNIGRLSSPGKRFGAYFLDLLVPVLALFLILLVAGAGAATGTDAGAGLGGLLGFGLIVAYIIWALVLFSRGTTPGKNLFGMRVVKEDGRNAGFVTMLLREWVGKAISGLVFALGFLWILFDRDKQGWHDKLMSTYVIERKTAAQPIAAGS